MAIWCEVQTMRAAGRGQRKDIRSERAGGTDVELVARHAEVVLDALDARRR